MIDQILRHWRLEGSLSHSEQEWLMDEVDRLKGLLTERTYSPRTYEQWAEDFKREVVNLIDAAVNNGALKDNYTFAAIRALPTRPEGERE